MFALYKTNTYSVGFVSEGGSECYLTPNVQFSDNTMYLALRKQITFDEMIMMSVLY
jgi:hypothetical protein